MNKDKSEKDIAISHILDLVKKVERTNFNGYGDDLIDVLIEKATLLQNGDLTLEDLNPEPSPKKYREVPSDEKLQLLNNHLSFCQWKSLDSKKWCLHCREQVQARDVLVYEEDGDEWLECGNEGCDGSPMDWRDEPW